MLYKLFTLFLICVSRIKGQEQTIVTINQGSVVGSLASNGDYYQFLGIPYADSTSGENRFKDPQAAPVFDELFYADRDDISCPAYIDGVVVGTEDCLTTSIYTPTITPEQPLSVIVWIKGNEFTENINYVNFSPRLLVGKDTIVVSLNFRQSIFGFLCLGTTEVPGNAGLKDIVAGLRWINTNIERFGGNPNSITLLGHGDGGAFVDLITLSPLASGLFQRAIIQSGNSLSPWAINGQPLVNAVAVAERLGFVVENPEELHETFRTINANLLLETASEIALLDNSLIFGPCVENSDTISENTLLFKSPGQILVEGDFVPVPMILGFVENEGSIRANKALEEGWLDQMEESFADFLQPDLSFASENQREMAANMIRSFYFQNRTIDMSSIYDFIRYQGDSLIIVSTLRAAYIRSRVSDEPLYLYQFSYEGQLGQAIAGTLSLSGATHSEDLAYLFDIGMDIDQNSLDNIIRDIVLDRWTNFAKTGNPYTDLSAIVWQPFTLESANLLNILNNDDSEDILNFEVNLLNPKPETVRFWSEIYNSYWKNDGTDDVIIQEENSDTANQEQVQVAELLNQDTDTTNSAYSWGSKLTLLVFFGYSVTFF